MHLPSFAATCRPHIADIDLVTTTTVHRGCLCPFLLHSNSPSITLRSFSIVRSSSSSRAQWSYHGYSTDSCSTRSNFTVSSLYRPTHHSQAGSFRRSVYFVHSSNKTKAAQKYTDYCSCARRTEIWWWWWWHSVWNNERVPSL